MDVLTVFCLFHSVTTKMTTSSLAGSYKDHFLFYIDLISAMTQHVGLFIHTKTVSFPYEFLRKKKTASVNLFKNTCKTMEVPAFRNHCVTYI